LFVVWNGRDWAGNFEETTCRACPRSIANDVACNANIIRSKFDITLDTRIPTWLTPDPSPFPHPPQPLRHIQESPARDRARGAPERRDVDRHGDASPRGGELDHVQVEGGPVPAAARDHHPLRTVGDVVHEPVRREEGDEPPVRAKVGADAGAGEGGETPS